MILIIESQMRIYTTLKKQLGVFQVNLLPSQQPIISQPIITKKKFIKKPKPQKKWDFPSEYVHVSLHLQHFS